jgi:hypothetical protein
LNFGQIFVLLEASSKILRLCFLLFFFPYGFIFKIFSAVFVVIEHNIKTIFLGEFLLELCQSNESYFVDVEHISESASSYFFKGYKFGFGHIFSLLNYKATAIYLRGERKSNFSYPLKSGAEYIAKTAISDGLCLQIFSLENS